MKCAEHIPAWSARALAWLQSQRPELTLADVRAPGDAWMIAHKAGFWKEANDAGVNDGPIQTALERIFPNVTFNDAKRY